MTHLTLLWALTACAPGAAPPAPPVDFNLRDAVGKTHRLADYRDRQAVVVVFLAVDCPLAKLYTPRLVDLAKEYDARGVSFLAIASRQETPRDLTRYMRRHGVTFPVLRDIGGVAAAQFGAERSPEAFVLDRGRRVRYRGRIDDQYAIGVQSPAPKRREMRDAIEAILAGRSVAVTTTTAPGCPLRLGDRPHVAAAVTYSRDVAPILQRRCQACHRPGQSAPFGLMRYADAANWAEAMREVIDEGRMPPWSANPRHGTFANDPSLGAEEKQTLFRWIDAGCPEGDIKDLPAPKSFPKEWSIPTPDLVVEMPEAFTVPAQGTIEYQYFRVDPGFREDRWVRAAEILPGNPAVVHHCNIFLQPPGFDDPTDIAEQGKLGSYCLTMMAQGTPPLVLSDGLAKRIPAGWRIVFVVHYQAVGSAQTDRTRLGLTFAAPKSVRQEVATRLLFDPDLRIPPGVADHRVSKEWAFDRDMHLLSLFPHMHLRGKSFRYELIRPDGGEEILLDVPRFDFGWQHRYTLAEPLLVKAGSRLRCTAVYDNSADNPANPDPTAEVQTGMQSWEEMFNGYFDVCLADEDLTRGPTWRERLSRYRGAVLLGCVAGGLFMGRRRIAWALGKAG
jgi:peroxiredoxin